ncbi:MAG: hypothetical protein M3463_00295 [Verrucomicrobiota bacterium]|nr:hypothetical protein [Verrucomicrobiota bacterium]
MALKVQPLPGGEQPPTVSLERALQEVYQFTLQQTKEDLTVRAIFDLWNKMVEICDFYLQFFPPGSELLQGLLGLRARSLDKREFHRCGW